MSKKLKWITLPLVDVLTELNTKGVIKVSLTDRETAVAAYEEKYRTSRISIITTKVTATYSEEL